MLSLCQGKLLWIIYIGFSLIEVKTSPCFNWLTFFRVQRSCLSCISIVSRPICLEGTEKLLISRLIIQAAASSMQCCSIDLCRIQDPTRLRLIWDTVFLIKFFLWPILKKGLFPHETEGRIVPSTKCVMPSHWFTQVSWDWGRVPTLSCRSSISPWKFCSTEIIEKCLTSTIRVNESNFM